MKHKCKVGKKGTKQYKKYHNDAVKEYRKRHHVVSMNFDTLEVLAKKCPTAHTVDAAVRELLQLPLAIGKNMTVMMRFRG